MSGNVIASGEFVFDVRSRVYMSGYKNVPVFWFVAKRARPLFGPNGSLGIPYAHAIEGYEIESMCRHSREDSLEELFAADEANTFVEFLRSQCSDFQQTKIRPVKLPVTAWPWAAMSTGRREGFLDIESDLPFRVRGYYDFDAAGCEYDETTAALRKLLHPDKDDGLPF